MIPLRNAVSQLRKVIDYRAEALPPGLKIERSVHQLVAFPTLNKRRPKESTFRALPKKTRAEAEHPILDKSRTKVRQLRVARG
jgi:hypothetical protein